MRKIELNCSNCHTKVLKFPSDLKKSKSGRVFCNRTCSTIFLNVHLKHNENHPGWKNGYASYRPRALKALGYKCNNPQCPITFQIPDKMYDVDHIDNNRKNNDLKNLQVLCVWCHALKTRKV